MGLLKNNDRVKTEQVHIRVDQRTKKDLFTLSEKAGVSASELIRRMIQDKAENHNMKRKSA